jgi:hypothetical protein
MTYLEPSEVATLLGIAASFDNRKANEEAVIAWRVALAGIPFADARDAIAAHYAESREWIMPADIRARVRRVRAKRIDEHPPLVPPPGLTDTEELAWLGASRRRIANGEVIDCDAAYELVAGSVRELLAAATPTTEGDLT